MDTLLFIRHAETDLAGRFCGHSDPPVNERGYLQIGELLKILKTEPIGAIYSSDLLRSMTTAEAIGRAFGFSPVAVPELREINFGEWEGLTWEEVESRDPEYARKWASAFPELPAPGGEPFKAFQSRVLAEVNKILAASEQDCAAVVTHAGVMRVVLRSFCGLSEEGAWQRTKSYCSLFHYTQGGKSMSSRFRALQGGKP
jgi:broad specificity phosphatase PhoE